MAELPATYEIRAEQGVVLIRMARGLVVLAIAQWISGIKRGKSWRRHGGYKPGECRRDPARGEIVQPGGE